MKWLLLLLSALWLGTTPAPAQPTPVVKYELLVDANLGARQLTVRGTAAFVAAENFRDSVDVVLHKTMGNPAFRLLSPKRDKFIIKKLEAGDGQTTYRFVFGHRLAVGQPVRIGFAYRGGRLPAFQFFLDSSYCLAGGYNVAWYPQVQARRRDNTTTAMEGTGTIRVTTARAFTPVIMGCESRQTFQGPQRVTRFTVPSPAIFSLFVGCYQRTDYAGAVPTTAYRLTRDTATAGYLHRSAAIIGALAEEFGPYPFRSFSLLEYPEDVSNKLSIGGSSEYAGITLPSSAFGSRFNYALFGHELAHQWWAVAVEAAGAKGTGMLSEGMAQFGSLQVVSRFDSAHAEQYRRTGYPGYVRDQCGLGYLTLALSGHDAALENVNGANAHALANSKGFLVLDLLAETIGRDRMGQGLRAIVQRHRHEPLTWEAFLAEIEQAAGQDLSWFYEQWFQRQGAPDWSLTWAQHGPAVALTIVQPAPFYRLRLELELLGVRGERTRQFIDLTSPTTQVSLPAAFPVQQVRLDPAFRVPHWEEQYRAPAQALAPVVGVRILRLAGKKEEANTAAEAALSRLTQPDCYGVEFALCYELGRLKVGQGPPGRDAAMNYFLRAIQSPVRDPNALVQVYYRLAQLAHAKGDRAVFTWAKTNALTADALNGNAAGMAKLLVGYQ
ncbi:hypothetical protein IC235_16710 [Hymenobacter sp. BT664]|uniref:Peptidase M1 membrane alanine aminopeptidase domain-containing protein n=1 Tax=Hymenobacter montanus TaxID=2771359 RepID=A0A927BFL8_9BACT|nr:M1 family aminopeptidase [Hymenobacter montanus]MBD2769531.1 hypothetical protein [Hymenobacter montanus]